MQEHWSNFEDGSMNSASEHDGAQNMIMLRNMTVLLQNMIVLRNVTVLHTDSKCC